MTNDSLNQCPRCGGPADNGHDRCYPPNPYFCTKCTAMPEEVVSREISVIRDEVYGAIHRTHNGELRNIDEVADSVMDYIRPYLTAPKPVSVALCAETLAGAHWNDGKIPTYEQMAKAVLDAAGVAYVD